MARAHAVDPNAGRCLLTNTDSDIQLAYCIPRDLDPSKLDNLESAWNLNHGSLNTDSRYNIFPVTRALGRLFDAGDWILVPTAQTVETYYADEMIPVGADFPQVANGIFEYTLLSRRSMEGTTIHRSSTKRSTGDQSLPLFEETAAHSYPFATLGIVRSHLHPRFVICDLGRKVIKTFFEFHRTLRKLEDTRAIDRPARIELGSRIMHAGCVYEKWSQQHLPPRPRLDFGAAPSISSSQQTRRRRIIATSMSTTNDPGMPRLSKWNLKELQDSSSKDSVPWYVKITRWQTLCELASCTEEEYDTDSDEVEDDDDDLCDLECDVDMGSVDTTVDSADVDMDTFGDGGVGEDVLQAEILSRSTSRARSMPPTYAETASSPQSLCDASSLPPRDSSSPSSYTPSTSPSGAQTAPGPLTPPPGPYRTMGSASHLAPSSGQKYRKRAFVEISGGDDVPLECAGSDVHIADGEEWSALPRRKRTRVVF
ncbi:hypothetical protein PLICRDRAFT_177953 [Plicaturopsis crispa FD-325 SS-3]|nr:hypothetical protein PLICRDRAFT_177953 [Plicaturopsis crispa FD-325 SS-3]